MSITMADSAATGGGAIWGTEPGSGCGMLLGLTLTDGVLAPRRGDGSGLPPQDAMNKEAMMVK